MDDIWSSYLVQTIFKENLVYAPASVYQDRNKQDLITNLEREVIGYRHTLDFIRSGCKLESEYIPKDTSIFYNLYKDCALKDIDFL